MPHIGRLSKLALVLASVALAATALRATMRRALPRERRIERARRAGLALLAKLGWEKAPKKVEIRVFKARRILELHGDGRLMLRCPCALGGAPTGDKEREGDLRTPEGSFYVCTRNDRSRFHLFLGLSYPDEEDARRGLEAGMIDARQAEAIRAAWRRRSRPPWNTALGGMVGIHGYGTAWDWTLGCIALADEDVERLWAFSPLGTTVVVRP